MKQQFLAWELIFSGCSFIIFLLTCRMEGRLSGFTLKISWLSSRSSSAGQCSSVQPRSLYEELSFKLQKDHCIEIFVSAASLFRCNSQSHLVFAEVLLFFLRSLVRMAAIAHNRRQISRSWVNNEWTINSSPKWGKWVMNWVETESRRKICNGSGLTKKEYYRFRVILLLIAAAHDYDPL